MRIEYIFSEDQKVFKQSANTSSKELLNHSQKVVNGLSKLIDEFLQKASIQEKETDIRQKITTKKKTVYPLGDNYLLNKNPSLEDNSLVDEISSLDLDESLPSDETSSLNENFVVDENSSLDESSPLGDNDSIDDVITSIVTHIQLLGTCKRNDGRIEQLNYQVKDLAHSSFAFLIGMEDVLSTLKLVTDFASNSILSYQEILKFSLLSVSTLSKINKEKLDLFKIEPVLCRLIVQLISFANDPMKEDKIFIKQINGFISQCFEIYAQKNPSTLAAFLEKIHKELPQTENKPVVSFESIVALAVNSAIPIWSEASKELQSCKEKNKLATFSFQLLLYAVKQKVSFEKAEMWFKAVQMRHDVYREINPGFQEEEVIFNFLIMFSDLTDPQVKAVVKEFFMWMIQSPNLYKKCLNNESNLLLDITNKMLLVEEDEKAVELVEKSLKLKGLINPREYQKWCDLHAALKAKEVELTNFLVKKFSDGKKREGNFLIDMQLFCDHFAHIEKTSFKQQQVVYIAARKVIDWLNTKEIGWLKNQETEFCCDGKNLDLEAATVFSSLKMLATELNLYVFFKTLLSRVFHAESPEELWQKIKVFVDFSLRLKENSEKNKILTEISLTKPLCSFDEVEAAFKSTKDCKDYSRVLLKKINCDQSFLYCFKKKKQQIEFDSKSREDYLRLFGDLLTHSKFLLECSSLAYVSLASDFNPSALIRFAAKSASLLNSELFYVEREKVTDLRDRVIICPLILKVLKMYRPDKADPLIDWKNYFEGCKQICMLATFIMKQLRKVIDEFQESAIGGIRGILAEVTELALELAQKEISYPPFRKVLMEAISEFKGFYLKKYIYPYLQLYLEMTLFKTDKLEDRKKFMVLLEETCKTPEFKQANSQMHQRVISQLKLFLKSHPNLLEKAISLVTKALESNNHETNDDLEASKLEKNTTI